MATIMDQNYLFLTQFLQVLLVRLHSNLDPEHFFITILAKSATMESGKHVLIIGKIHKIQICCACMGMS